MVFNKKKQAKVRVSLWICLLCTFFTIIRVDAAEEDEHERGNLRINSHVISDTREGVKHHASIGFEEASFLFLENMTEMEASRVQTHHKRLEQTRMTVFTTDVVADRLDTSEIVTMLFQDTEEVNEGRLFEETYTLYFEVPIWLWAIIGIVSTTVLGSIGVLVGQKISQLILKNQILTKEGEVND